MICKLSFENFLAYADRVDLTFEADLRIKRLLNNAQDIANKSILKSIGVYGPNNSGKTCFCNAIATLQKIMTGDITRVGSISNIFAKNHITKFLVEFESNQKFYRYQVAYISQSKTYMEESLDYIILNTANRSSVRYSPIFKRTVDEVQIYRSGENELETMMDTIGLKVSEHSPFINTFTFKTNSLITAQKDYNSFVQSILTFTMDNPDIGKAFDYFAKNDQDATKFITSFVKNCDLNIDDFGCSDTINVLGPVNNQIVNTLNSNQSNAVALRLWSQHRNIRVPSIVFDSLGTRKIVCLAAYIYDALKFGKTLIIDEIDSSLHHILTRSILALFNNELNDKAQLIFSTHDLLLLDFKHLLRKDQVFLTDIDKESHNSIIIPISSFTAEKDGFRGTEDVVDYYTKGAFGGIPSPDLFSSLLEIKEGKN